MSETNDMKKAINYTDLAIVKEYIDQQVAAAIAKFTGGTETAAKASKDSNGNVISETYLKKTETAGNATKAAQDSDGNVISETYLKKTDKTYEAPSAKRLKEGSIEAYLELYPYAKPGYGETGYDASASNDIVRIVTQKAPSSSMGEPTSHDTYVDIAGKTKSTDFTNAEWIDGTRYLYNLGSNKYVYGEYIPREDLVQGATYEINFYTHQDTGVSSKHKNPVLHCILTYNMNANDERHIMVNQTVHPYTGTPSTTEAAKGFKAGDFDISTYGIRISKTGTSMSAVESNAISYVCITTSYEQSIEGDEFNDLKIVIAEKSQPRYGQSPVLYDVQYRRIK